MANAQPNFQQCESCSESSIAIAAATCPKCGSSELRPIVARSLPAAVKTFETLSDAEQSEVHLGMNLVVSDLVGWFKNQGTPPRIAMIAASVYVEMAKIVEEGGNPSQEMIESHVVTLWDRYVAPLELRVKGGHA
jgi:ribosomal protein L40E